MSRLAGMMPMTLSATSTTGKRKPRPKTRMNRVTKAKYIDTCWMFEVPLGLIPYKIANDCGRIV